MSTVAPEMERLADEIDRLTRASPCYSSVYEIVRNCTNHLRVDAVHRRSIHEKARHEAGQGKSATADDVSGGVPPS